MKNTETKMAKRKATPAINGLAAKRQRGIALLGALILIIILALLGFRIAMQSKDSTAMTGADVRYNQVFEAAETTLRRAMLYIQNVKGPPLATDVPKYNAQHKEVYENFDKTQLVKAGVPTQWGEYLSLLPEYAFVWKNGALSEEICKKSDSCEANKGTFYSGVDFFSLLDDDVWATLGVHSQFGGAAGNYVGDIRTYTFVEEMKSIIDSEGEGYASGSGAEGGESNDTVYYLITVKASGYPPRAAGGAASAAAAYYDDVSNARENVILQSVYAR